MLGNKVKITGLDIDSLQGDKVILNIIKQMGGNIEIYNDKVIASNSKTKGAVIDVSQCPRFGSNISSTCIIK